VLGAYAPQISKMYNKNIDTVHNAPCIEERSTFLQKNTPPFSTFFSKPPFFQNTDIFHFFYKKTPPPISFPAYRPGEVVYFMIVIPTSDEQINMSPKCA